MSGPSPSCPVSLRISVTDRCQMRCLYCMPLSGIPKVPHDQILTFEEIVRFVELVKSRFGLAKVRLTGGDPLVRKDFVKLVEMLSCMEIPDLSLTTNGQRLAQLAPSLKRAGLHRVNVSLDSLDEKTYRDLSRGGDLHATLHGIETAVKCGLGPVKINTVLLRGFNDGEIARLAGWAIERGCTIRFLEIMGIGQAKTMAKMLLVSSAEVFSVLERSFRLTPMVHKPGQTSRSFFAADREGRTGTIGLISSVTQPFCAECNRLRLTSTGQLIGCLARGEGPSIRSMLGSSSSENRESLVAVIADELGRKTGRTSFDTATSMAAIGG